MPRFIRYAFLFAVAVSVVALARPAAAQQHPAQKQTDKTTDKTEVSDNANSSDTIVLSGVATTARIADPNEPVVFNGLVMRMADFVAVVSASSEAAQHPRTPEKRNREKDQPTPPSPPSH